ncbi:hypothetical protein OSB04_021111, partial [Centaurea solstitialis]
MISHLRSYSKDHNITPPYLEEPLIAGSTLEVRSLTGMKPLPAAVAAAGRPKKIFDFGMPEVHCFQPSS